MTDGVPLRLRLDPGTYSVVWQFPLRDGTTAERQGEVSLEANAAPTGYVFEDVDVEWRVDESGARSAGFPQVRSVQWLRGVLLNGLQLGLIDANITVWASERASVSARAAAVGFDLDFSGDTSVLSLEVQVEGLDAVAGTGPISQVEFPKMTTGTRYLEGRWSAVGNPDSTQTWSDSTVDLELRFRNSVTLGDPFFFRVAFSPVLTLALRTPIPFNDVFSDWVEPLRRILTLSTGRQERVTYIAIKFSSSTDDSFAQVFGTALHQAPYASRGNKVQTLDRTFFISHAGTSLLELIRRWQDIAAAHHPLLETYGSMMFAREQHPRSRLLLLMQALEGWYGYEKRETLDEVQAAYELRRTAALFAAVSTLEREDAQFIKRHLQRRVQGGLEQALRSAVDEAPVNIKARLEETALVRALMLRDPAPREVFDALRIVRNELSHGVRGFDLSDLAVVAELLDRLVQAHLLKVLGLPEDAQSRAQNRGT